MLFSTNTHLYRSHLRPFSCDDSDWIAAAQALLLPSSFLEISYKADESVQLCRGVGVVFVFCESFSFFFFIFLPLTHLLTLSLRSFRSSSSSNCSYSVWQWESKQNFLVCKNPADRHNSGIQSVDKYSLMHIARENI